MSTAPILEVRAAGKIYSGKGSTVEAVKSLTLSLEPGVVLGIIGESGSGKSTLAKLITGLENLTSGDILFQGESVEQWLRRDRRAFRQQCQMVFQNPFESFDPLRTIAASLMEAVGIYHREWSPAQRRAYCCRELERYGLIPAEDILCRYPHQLSGGQLQRVAILRAMIPEPKLLLADEAVSMLDVSVRADVINLFGRIAREHHTAMVFISHDILTASYLADRMGVMFKGELVEYGDTGTVVREPIHPYTQALVSCCGDLSGRIDTRFLGGRSSLAQQEGGGCPYRGRCPRAQAQCSRQVPALTERQPGHFVRCAI